MHAPPGGWCWCAPTPNASSCCSTTRWSPTIRASFRRDQIIYDPWHYLPVLMRKPGALRNGAPFKDWDLPPALAQVRAKLKQHADGDRQFVKVLGAVLDHGLAAVEAACAEALEAGIASGDVILTVLARRRQPARRRPASPRPMRCA